MNSSQFLAQFGTIADAPNGVQRLREMILQLAVMGKLVPQDPADEPASVLLQRIAADFPTSPFAKGRAEKCFDLPQSWEWVRLGDFSKIKGGKRLPPNHKFSSNKTPYIYIQVTNMKNGTILSDNLKYLSQETQQEISKYTISKNDLYITIAGTIGDIGIVPEEFDGMNLTENAAKIVFKIINRNWLKEVLSSNFLQMQFFEKTNQQAQPKLALNRIASAYIPLPPLAEQKRIVAKVDSLMALCDKLETLQQQRQQLDPITQTAVLDALLTPNVPPSLTRPAASTRRFAPPQGVEGTISYDLSVLLPSPLAGEGLGMGGALAWQRLNQHMTTLFHTPESVKALRETILQLAVMGKLVPQDPHDEPAAVLLQHIAAEKDRLIQEGKIKRQKPLPAISDDEKPFELPNGWEWVRLASVTELITSGSRDWAQYYSNSGAIFIRMGNLSRGHYEMRLSNIQYISPPNDGEGSRTKLEESDLLISITGDVGMLGLVPANFGEAYINQHTCLVRFMSTCRNRYFPELLRSPLAMDQFNAPQRGIKNSFRLGDVGEMLIPLPPLAEQRRIVAKVDSLMALCDKLEARLRAARATAGLFAAEAVTQIA